MDCNLINMFSFQTCNALFILRIVLKFMVERIKEEVSITVNMTGKHVILLSD